jgi:hypothetical protein
VRGRIRARRGEPEAWPALDRARELAERTGSLQRIAPVAAARAEARWLTGQGPDDGLAPAYRLAADKRNAWAAGELGLWMWRHGLLAEAPAFAAEPYRLNIDGDPTGAAAAWIRLGCPYEAADAGADAADQDDVRAALATFTAFGATPAGSGRPGGCASSGSARSRAGRGPAPARTG